MRPFPLRSLGLGLIALIALLTSRPAPAAAADDAKATVSPIARRGYDFLKKYCHSCHGVEEEEPGLKVLERDTLVAPPRGKRPPFVDAEAPDHPERSLVWLKAVKTKEMPPPLRRRDPD